MFAEKLNDSASASFKHTTNNRKRARCKILQFFVMGLVVCLHFDKFANVEKFQPQKRFVIRQYQITSRPRPKPRPCLFHRDQDRDRDLVFFIETETLSFLSRPRPPSLICSKFSSNIFINCQFKVKC